MIPLAFAATLLTILGSATAKADEYEKCTPKDCSGYVACASVFQHQDFQGWAQCFSFKDDECLNLNDWWTSLGSRVSSVNSHQTCIRLHEKPNCLGTSIEINKESSKFQGNLGKWNFDERTHSISSCRRSGNNTGCQAETLFLEYVDFKIILKNSLQLMQNSHGVARSINGNGNSSFVPELDTFLNSLSNLREQLSNESTRKKTSGKLFMTHVQKISDQIKSAVAPVTSNGERKIDLVLATRTCEEMRSALEHELVEKTKDTGLTNSPFVLVTAALCTSVLNIKTKLLPDNDSAIRKKYDKLLESYRQQVILERTENFKLTAFFRGCFIKDEMSQAKVDMSAWPSPECKNGPCGEGERCRSCLKNIKDSLETKISYYFQQVISKVNEASE